MYIYFACEAPQTAAVESSPVSPRGPAPSAETLSGTTRCQLFWESANLIRSACVYVLSQELVDSLAKSSGELTDAALAGESVARAENLMVAEHALAAGRSHYRYLSDSPARQEKLTDGRVAVTLSSFFEVLAQHELAAKTFPVGQEPIPLTKAIEHTRRSP